MGVLAASCERSVARLTGKFLGLAESTMLPRFESLGGDFL
jgi:hypothetical protein